MEITGMTISGCLIGEITCDPIYANVSLLLPMNGTNGSTSFTDYSSSPKTISSNGNAQISTTIFKWNGSSGYLDGAGDYLTSGTNAGWQFGTGDFTVEMWVYPLSVTQVAALFDTRGSTNTSNGIAFGAPEAGSAINVFVFPTVYTFSDLIVTINEWQHLAWVRQSNVMKAFKNGIQSATTYTITNNFTETTFTFGTNINNRLTPNSQPTAYSMAYYNDFRITKGVARYSGNFTPPTAPFPTTGC